MLPRILARLWASPMTLIGLVVGGFTLITGGGGQLKCGVWEFYGGFARSFLTWRLVGAKAMTLGHVIIGRDRICLDNERDHERAHVRQAEIWGPLFLPAYLAASAVAFMTGRDYYNDNWFEIDADRRCGIEHPS
jgi:hypothetical protein